ncbi:MAG: hypothetical protein HY828_18355 [Actinobacteria bacterium]|nr:hypothetical protein [Actinomycetota bacterium]
MTTFDPINTWTGHVDWTVDDQVDIDTEAVAGWLLEFTAADSAAFGPRRLSATFPLHAPSYSKAYERLRLELTSTKQVTGGLTVVNVEVQRADHLDAELARPVLPALVGITEAAEILGVTRQRAHAIAQQPRFPRPVAELASGPVYLEHAVRAFADQPRRAGRPANPTAQAG